jgi:diguanylate cyclase (GGDEF)-like protein
MPRFTFDVAVTFTAQIISAVAMALILLGFYRRYRKSYLQHWTLGWAALAVYDIGNLAIRVSGAVFNFPATHPARLVATIAGSVAGYTHIGWFCFGVYELLRRRPVRLRDARRILLFLTAFGGLTALLFLDATTFSVTRNFARVGVRAALAAIAFGITAMVLWRVRGRREGIGGKILGAAFFFYAIELFQYFFFGLSSMMGGAFVDLVGPLGYADFLVQSLLAVGMIACLLEDEREAAELASVEIEHLAYHDALTGLPNRPLFIDRLIVSVAQASRSGQLLAVLFLDLDRFKDINDSLGHSTGDQLLKAVAERIRRCVREGDTVARFGGDEFTLLVPRVENIEDAAKIAQKIIETLKIPFEINERELFVTTSIGISIYPTDGLDAETLVRSADMAMYRAKDSGRDNYQLYAPAMNALALQRLALENMLRKALTHKELVLHYQPLVDVRTRAVIGMEALVRWEQPDLGMLLPAHFISVAELSGLIIPMGQWVLDAACRQLRTWQRKLHRNLYVSVNLSARQFQQPDLVEQVQAAVRENGIDPASLELEITESNAMANAENSIHTLRELKALGVRIAMDDFGTGYSSLNYLKRFPIDTLKLDQSFVRDINIEPSDAAIVSAAIAMAHSLKLDVVAEGVETEEQLAFLQKQGCDIIQGYFFSPPLPAENFENYLVSRRASAG